MQYGKKPSTITAFREQYLHSGMDFIVTEWNPHDEDEGIAMDGHDVTEESSVVISMSYRLEKPRRRKSLST